MAKGCSFQTSVLSCLFLRSELDHEWKRIGVSVLCMCCSLSQNREGVSSLCLGGKLLMATDWSEVECLGSHEERQEEALGGLVVWQQGKRYVQS